MTIRRCGGSSSFPYPFLCGSSIHRLSPSCWRAAFAGQFWGRGATAPTCSCSRPCSEMTGSWTARPARASPGMSLKTYLNTDASERLLRRLWHDWDLFKTTAPVLSMPRGVLATGAVVRASCRYNAALCWGLRSEVVKRQEEGDGGRRDVRVVVEEVLLEAEAGSWPFSRLGVLDNDLLRTFLREIRRLVGSPVGSDVRKRLRTVWRRALHHGAVEERALCFLNLWCSARSAC